MRQHNAFLLLALIGSTALTGCANARFVKTDQESGVVALPANTNCWPNYYRDHAEALMREKCPNGYEVVCEEEAVVAQTVHTHTDTETTPSPTLNFGGAKTETNTNGNSEHGSGAFAGVAVPLGKTEEKSRQTTNTQNVTEWHIHYRAKRPGPPGPPTPAGLVGSPAPPAPAGQLASPRSYAPRPY
jgi:hypothetical protein